MTQNPGVRIRGLQPQLPLIEAGPDAHDRTHQAPSDEDRDWRLDAQTREAGRRGIAAARTQLRSVSGRAA